MVVDLARASQALAEHELESAQTRLAHVAGVAEKLGQAVACLRPPCVPEATAAAWLHDIGYAPAFRTTGLHALDGASALAKLGFPPLVCQLVAYHSGAEFEAAARGLTQELARFRPPRKDLLDLLTWADMTTSPAGAPVRVKQRLDEILLRYPDSDPVHRAVRAARPELEASVRRVNRRLVRVPGAG